MVGQVQSNVHAVRSQSSGGVRVSAGAKVCLAVFRHCPGPCSYKAVLVLFRQHLAPKRMRPEWVAGVGDGRCLEGTWGFSLFLSGSAKL